MTRLYYLYSYKSILTQEKDAVLMRLKERKYKEKVIKVVVGIKINSDVNSSPNAIPPTPPLKRRKV